MSGKNSPGTPYSIKNLQIHPFNKKTKHNFLVMLSKDKSCWNKRAMTLLHFIEPIKIYNVGA